MLSAGAGTGSQPAANSWASAVKKGGAKPSAPEPPMQHPGRREGLAGERPPSRSPSRAASVRSAGPRPGVRSPSPFGRPTPELSETAYSDTAGVSGSAADHGISPESSWEHVLVEQPLSEVPPSYLQPPYLEPSPAVGRPADAAVETEEVAAEDWVTLLGGGGGDDLGGMLPDRHSAPVLTWDAPPVIQEEVPPAWGRSASPQPLWPSSVGGPSAALAPPSGPLQLGGFSPWSSHGGFAAAPPSLGTSLTGQTVDFSDPMIPWSSDAASYGGPPGFQSAGWGQGSAPAPSAGLWRPGLSSACPILQPNFSRAVQS